MTSYDPFLATEGDGDSLVAQDGSPVSEIAVDELLTTSDNAITTTLSDVRPLPPSRVGNTHHVSLLRSGSESGISGSGDSRRPDAPLGRPQTSKHSNTMASQPRVHSSLDVSRRNSRPDTLNTMRGALVQSFHKAIHLRYPKSKHDSDQLEERIAKKLTDAEVRDFIRMGRGVVEDLKQSGKLEAVKRKLAIQNLDEDSEVRRTRRRIDKITSLVSAEAARSTKRMEVSRPSNLPAVSGILRTPEPSQAGQTEAPSIASGSQREERPSTPRHNVMKKDISKSPRYHASDVISISPAVSEQPSPHYNRSSVPPKSDHNKDVDVTIPPSHGHLEPSPTTSERRGLTPTCHGTQQVTSEPASPVSDGIPMSISPSERSLISPRPKPSSIATNSEGHKDVDVDVLPSYNRHCRGELSSTPTEQDSPKPSHNAVQQQISEPAGPFLSNVVPVSISSPKQSPGAPQLGPSIPTNSEIDKDTTIPSVGHSGSSPILEERRASTPTSSGIQEETLKSPCCALRVDVPMSMSPEGPLSPTQRSHSPILRTATRTADHHDVVVPPLDTLPPTSNEQRPSTPACISTQLELETSQTPNKQRPSTPACMGTQLELETPQTPSRSLSNDVPISMPPLKRPLESQAAHLPNCSKDDTIPPQSESLLALPLTTVEQRPHSMATCSDTQFEPETTKPRHIDVNIARSMSPSFHQPPEAPSFEHSSDIPNIAVIAHGPFDSSPTTGQSHSTLFHNDSTQPEKLHHLTDDVATSMLLSIQPPRGSSPSRDSVIAKQAGFHEDVTILPRGQVEPPLTIDGQNSPTAMHNAAQQETFKSPSHHLIDEVPMPLPASVQLGGSPHSGHSPILDSVHDKDVATIPRGNLEPLTTDEQRSTPTPIGGTQQESSKLPHHIVSMSMSLSNERPPELPHREISPITSPGHHRNVTNPLQIRLGSPLATFERPSTSSCIDGTQQRVFNAQHLRIDIPTSMSFRESTQRPAETPHSNKQSSTPSHADHFRDPTDLHGHFELSSAADGTLEVSKRKFVALDWDKESEVKRNRRLIDSSPPPVSTEVAPNTDREAVSYPSDVPAAGGTLRASHVMTGQNEGLSVASGSGAPKPKYNGHQQESSVVLNRTLADGDSISMSPPVNLHPGLPHVVPDHHPSVLMPPHVGLEAGPITDDPEASQTVNKQPLFLDPMDDATNEMNNELSDLRSSRVLLAKVGLPMPDILDASFDVDEQMFNAVQRWGQRWKEFV